MRSISTLVIDTAAFPEVLGPFTVGIPSVVPAATVKEGGECQLSLPENISNMAENHKCWKNIKCLPNTIAVATITLPVRADKPEPSSFSLKGVGIHSCTVAPAVMSKSVASGGPGDGSVVVAAWVGSGSACLQ